MKFLVEYTTMKAGASRDDFFLGTTAEWTPCEMPSGTPDFVSPSGSAYFYTGEGVVRLSNHWAGVASCCWWYGDVCRKQFDGPVAAFCAWEGFTREAVVREEREMPKGTRARTWAVDGGQGYKVISKAA